MQNVTQSPNWFKVERRKATRGSNAQKNKKGQNREGEKKEKKGKKGEGKEKEISGAYKEAQSSKITTGKRKEIRKGEATAS